MKNFFNFLGNIGAMIIAFIIYGVIEQLYFYPQVVKRKFHISSDNTYMIGIAILTLIGALLIYAFYRWQLKRLNNHDLSQKFLLNNRQLLISLLGVVLILAANIVIPIILGINNSTTSNNQEALNRISLQSGNLYGVIVVIVAPIFEELIFRGLFFNTFFFKDTPANKWLGILCSGLIFGIVHDPKFTKYLVLYWAMGSILAWVYMRARDIRCSMMTHMFNNLLALIAI